MAGEVQHHVDQAQQDERDYQQVQHRLDGSPLARNHHCADKDGGASKLLARAALARARQSVGRASHARGSMLS